MLEDWKTRYKWYSKVVNRLKTIKKINPYVSPPDRYDVFLFFFFSKSGF